jgi:hypothetical protein
MLSVWLIFESLTYPIILKRMRRTEEIINYKKKSFCPCSSLLSLTLTNQNENKHILVNRANNPQPQIRNRPNGERKKR